MRMTSDPKSCLADMLHAWCPYILYCPFAMHNAMAVSCRSLSQVLSSFCPFTACDLSGGNCCIALWMSLICCSVRL